MDVETISAISALIFISPMIYVHIHTSLVTLNYPFLTTATINFFQLDEIETHFKANLLTTAFPTLYNFTKEEVGEILCLWNCLLTTQSQQS